jgi:hypothetical protein
VDFFSFLRNIGDVDTALSFHTACGSDLNPGKPLFSTQEPTRNARKTINFQINFNFLKLINLHVPFF